ncbi:MAG: RNA polymerase sigma factor [Mucilaginibacter sp.]
MWKSLPDDELLSRIKKDDQQAFSAIVFRYNIKLYRLVYNRVRREDDVKDIVQEIFISLWKNRHQVKSPELFPYLAKAAFYAVIDWQLLHRKNISRHHLLLEKDEPYSLPAEDQIIAKELRQELMEEINRMPETTGLVFRMSRIEEKSVKEIAATTNLSEQTVKNNLSIALKHLRRRMLQGKLSAILFFIF